MEPLRPSDPSRIAGHRLLGRLGSGGMGVVYLARTPGGALVALKVLLAEYAEEPGFKERFRREVEVARRVVSPWAVPLVDADPDAGAPWLATAFVPGPSLAEAVAAHGPLAEHGVRLLGARLAEALGEVHRAGLVHRDLKPGNVLIAHDGPRLIDFGIARAPEDTALTATGLVVGTPGYLSPEQATGPGGDGIGPASDVFSLGCVLAFAATGRPPFGTGPVDALLYRAVHDPADLDGIPPRLREAVEDCLAKDPARRPETALLARRLAALRDPRTTAPADSGPQDAAAAANDDARDTTTGDAGPRDTGAGDAGPRDTGAGDGGPRDTAAGDGGPRDTAAGDGGPRDTAAGDGGPRDTRAADNDSRDAVAGDGRHGGAGTADNGPRDAVAGDNGPRDAEVDGWLPEPVARLIAERSAAALALPDIEHTQAPSDAAPASVPGPAPSPDTAGRSGTGRAETGAGDTAGAGRAEADTQGTAAGPAAEAEGGAEGVRAAGRRRFLLLAGGAVALTAAGGGAWWAAARDDDGTGGGSPAAAASARRPVHTVALHGDLSGPQRDTGRAQERGLRLAVAEFNARADAPFTVRVRTVDDGGNPAASARLAAELAGDPAVLAVVGPTTDATAQAALGKYDAGLLPVVAVSPGAISLVLQGFRSFLLGRLPDSVLGVYLSNYLRGSGRSRKVGLVVDRPAGTYGTDLGTALATQLSNAGQPPVPEVVSAMRRDFGTAVDAVLSAGVDSVFFAGLPDRGALIASTLRERGFRGARVSGPALLDGRFLTRAQEAAEGWAMVAPVIDATGKPEARKFAAAYRERWKEAPPRYAAEAYDVTGMLLTALSRLPAAGRTRKNLLAAVQTGKYEGITKTFAFEQTGKMVRTGLMVIDGTGGFLWRVEQGDFVYGGPAPLTV
ncbi:ABC transporter substrate-binding protein [Streptomyces sp. NBC_00704]|uniref:protein kinase domain-containing protein n=1 Tax=Streptomyces sp. NBC_00704 TaxID=2975809 RepID=UPI002E2EA78B|nr:ABC transporter substrate-binding protein [Streptomyces sp. NBC_00704]